MNPGGRWNSNVMWDAREAMVPGSVYDRHQRGSSNRTTDPMTRISPHMGTVPGMNVPMNMIMGNQFKKPPPANRSHRNWLLHCILYII